MSNNINSTKCYIFLALSTLAVCLLIASMFTSFSNNFFRSMQSSSMNLAQFYCNDLITEIEESLCLDADILNPNFAA